MSALNIRPENSKLVKTTIAIAVSAALIPNAFAGETVDLTNSTVNSTTNGATVSGDKSTVTVLNGQTIINWDTFGLANTESIDFNNSQGTMTGTVVLNRVIGSDSSLIDGTVTTSNIESLIFANANGITVGDNFVNTGAGTSNLLFSTKDISSLSGYDSAADNFGLTLGTDNNADLIVNGTISTIEPANYKLGLVSGNDVIIGASGDDGDKIATSFLTITADGAVNGANSTLDVDGEVSISAGGDVSINTIKSAPLFIDAGGNITVDQQQGVLEVGQLEGANIDITASQVIVEGSVELNLPITATTDAQVATNTSFSGDENFISNGTITINSNDIASNDLTVGSSGNALSIKSTGGTLTTTGATVGDLYFELDGSLNLGDVATDGDIEITEQAGATSSLNQTGTISLNTSGASVLDFSGVDVTGLDVTKTGGSLTVNANDLTFGDTINVTGNTLTLDASGTITGVAGNDVTANKLVLDGGASTAGDLDTTVGVLDLTDVSSVNVVNSGDISIGASNISGDATVDVAAGDDILVNNLVDIESGGSLILTSGDSAGEITISGAITGDDATLTLESDNLTINSAINTSTTNIYTQTANGTIDLENSLNASSTLELGAASVTNLFSDSAGLDRTINIGEAGNTGAVTISETITNSNAELNITGGNVSISAATTTDSLTVESSGTTTSTGKLTANEISITASGDVNIVTAATDIEVDAGAGDITILEDDDINLHDIVTTSTNSTALDITSTAGSITSEDATSIGVTGGEIALSAGNDIDVNVTGNSTFNSLSDGGDITITSDTSNVTFGDDVGDTGTLSVTGLTINSANNIDTGDDAITISGDLDLTAGSALLVGGAISATGSVDLSGGTVEAAAITSDSDTSGGDGDITLSAATDFTLNGSVTSNNSDITVKGNSDSVTLDLGTAGSGNLNLTQSELDLLQAGTGEITFGMETGGAISIDGVDLNTTTTHAGINVLTAGALTTQNALDLGSDALTIAADSIVNTGSTVITAGDVELVVTNDADLSGINLISGSVSGTTGGALSVNNGQGLDFGVTTADSISSTITGAGGITDSGTITTGDVTLATSATNGSVILDDDSNALSGTVTIAAGTGDITLDNDATDLALVVTSGNDVTIEDAGMVDLQGSVGNNLLVSSSTGITDSGTLMVAGTTGLTT
ncbi:filamentous hemagglutinin N-terminal domain-containing protein, partial [Psychrosphaera sp. I2R16]